MNHPEQQFYHYLRGELPGDVQRIENAHSPGTPDLNVCHCGIDVWVELKIWTDKGIILRKEQHAWAMRRSSNGGRVFVIARKLDQKHPIYVWRYPLVIVDPVGKSESHVRMRYYPFGLQMQDVINSLFTP